MEDSMSLITCSVCNVAYIETQEGIGRDCPVCKNKREIRKKDILIRQLINNKELTSNSRVVDARFVAKAVNRKLSTIYQDRSKGNKLNIPFRRNGQKLGITLSELKKWATANNELLNI
jgi:hypothetical protein